MPEAAGNRDVKERTSCGLSQGGRKNRNLSYADCSEIRLLHHKQ